ncbi:ICE2-domain-containing protein [Rhodotorula diobovata]|uniref:ICE2-domain-containing protein n=1 Tax=Rhodotorula diobovata TaxID=5288 RepID=A0A5C5FN78_9BASI|nr:ICE2-domain-containing protein [Rhodotorula diobovata]
MMLERILRVGAHSLSIAQVLLYLPLTLDIAEPGKEAMLALSLMLTVSFAISATLHLVVRNTKLRPVSTLLAWLSPLLIPALLLLTLNLYSTPSPASASVAHSLRDKVLHPHASSPPAPSAPSLPLSDSLVAVARAAPSAWERVLRHSSPVFTILEGLSTLLCIQAVSRFTVARVDAGRSPDLLRMLVLIVAAGVYVISAYFLWESYGAVPDRLSSTLIGVAVTTILFLSGISFSIQKGNVIETALMLAYVTFQVFHLSMHRPQMYTAGLLKHVFKAPGTNGHPPLPPVVLQSLDAVTSAVSQTFGAAVDFFMTASSALPFSVIVTLFYRVFVMYAATRVVLALKRRTGGYEDNRKLSEEEPAARVMTVVLTYSRSLLIAVYTHLLLLSEAQGAQVLWRWVNVFWVAALWALELRLGAHVDEDDGAGRWKSE